MMENELQKRFSELALRAESDWCYTETHFLTEGEQALLRSSPVPVSFSLEGAFPEAERCIAVFGDEETFGYPWESTLAILKIAPKDEKFGEDLTHRDYLGALLNLGIKRECLGDILVEGKNGYLAAEKSIVPYLEENLKRVRHTAVRLSVLEEIPSGVGNRFEETTVVAASPRVDAVIAALWNLSRSDGKSLVEKEKVSIFGAILTDPSRMLKEGERVSVRGFGRFYFDGAVGETRSGRCRIKLRVFV